MIFRFLIIYIVIFNFYKVFKVIVANDINISTSNLISNETKSMLLTKVVVPSVYHEWISNQPEWVTSQEIKNKFGYEVFLYQKQDPNKPNYMKTNRGTEAGVFLRYIVDHYYNFPDVAVRTFIYNILYCNYSFSN